MLVSVRRRLAPTIAAAALALVLTHAAPAPAAQSGVSMNLAQATDAGVQDRLAAAGARWVRFFMTWPAAEPQRGVFDPAVLAAARQAGELARARGLKLQIVFTQSPSWASGNASPIAPPLDVADYATAIGHWARELRGLVDSWEVWNEPDTKDFWLDGPQPARYAALLRAAHAAIKAADPAARVGLAPLTGNNHAFLARLYELGARPYFDTVSVHTDTGCLLAPPEQYGRERDGRISQWSFLGYRTVRDLMVAHGDGRKPILMSELGWNSSQTTCDRGIWAGTKLSGVSEAQQAANLRMAFHCMARDRYVESALWFNYHDETVADTHNGRYGLFRPDGSPKPVWDAFVDVSRGVDTVRAPCGDFARPTISVRRTGDRLRIVVRDGSGVRRIRVVGAAGGARTISRRATPRTLTVTVRGAGRAIAIRTSDASGNVATRTIAGRSQ